MAMTAREKLKLEHPNRVDDDHLGGCVGCPDTYGYLEEPDYCDPKTRSDEECRRCWDREIPEDLEQKLASIPEVEPDEIDKAMIKAAEKLKEAWDHQKVAFLCDKKQCEKCNSECNHTLDIRHAVNFKDVGDGHWMEKTPMEQYEEGKATLNEVRAKMGLPRIEKVEDIQEHFVDYKAEYERVKLVIDENVQDILRLKHDIETKDALIEEQRNTIDKMRTVIRCVEAFLGKEFLYV